MLKLPILSKIRNRNNEPEDSITLRSLVFAAQVVAFIAVAFITGLWPVALIGSALLGVGHVYSYQARNKPRKWVRWSVFIAIHLAFCGLFTLLFSGIPYPQVIVAVLVTGIVSFEFFKRLNLFSGLGLALINLYVAATLSRGTTFIFFLLIVLGIALACLWVADAQDGLKQNKVVLRRSREKQGRGGLAGWSLQFALVLLVLASMVFIFTPHFAGRPLFMPITIRVPIEAQPSSQIINPAVPLVQFQGTAAQPDEASEYYFGFADNLDLSYRGNLSDTIMMYVSSPAWSYWRGYAYDSYDGRTWSQSNDELDVIDSRYRANFLLDDDYEGPTFVQSFYIQQDMPNVLWAGGTPVEVFFPSEQIALDQTGGVRLGQSLDAGMIYSVISAPQNFEPEALQAASTDYPAEITDLYLQLPDAVTDRTRNLALELTAGLTTDYDKVIAIRDHLLTTYPYDFFPPPQAPNTDAVDQFLFVDQRGVCEHYVSSMIVMLRELGIPSRFVVGYGSGDYNRFTGFYEVRANDAHAWVEAFFPGYGWVPFDPTPGWNGNPQTGPVDRWVFSELFDNSQLPNISFRAIGEAGGAVLGFVAGPLILLGALSVVAGFGFSLWQLWGRFGVRIQRRLQLDPARRQIFAAYRRAQRQLRSRRADGQTVQEHADSVPELKELAEAVDRAAYDPQPLTPSWVERALRWRRPAK